MKIVVIACWAVLLMSCGQKKESGQAGKTEAPTAKPDTATTTKKTIVFFW